MRGTDPRRGPTLRGVLAKRHALTATCLSCWHQSVGVYPAVLAAAHGEGTPLEEIAKRMLPSVLRLRYLRH